MPIKVQCACGAAFAAKDELAGRTVKCPKCQQPLTIPAMAAPVAAAPQLAAPRSAQAAPAAHPAGDFFADAGLHAQQAGTAPCPGCAQPMPFNAVVCIRCGYNKKIGRRMDTLKQTEGPLLPGGHTVTADEMLTSAAARIEEEKEEERKKVKEGMPWWLLLIGLVVIVGFMIGMMLIPQEMALTVAGFSIIGLSTLVTLYSGIRLIIIAFQESTLQGILFMFVPFYWLIYVFSRWDKCGGLFLMNFVANLLGWAGYFAIVYSDVLGKPAAG